MKEGLTIGQLSEINAELHAEIAALKKQRDALAAENTQLKEYRPQPGGPAMMEALDAFFEKEEYPEGAMMDAFEILCCKRALPATDAAIANIQAQGVEKFADDCDSDVVFVEPEDTEHYELMAEHARRFAAELRKESTHD